MEGMDPFKAPVPEFEQDSYDLAMKKCRENVCGTYDTNWGCSPGARRDVPRFYAENDFVLVITRAAVIDWHDKQALDGFMKEMQQRTREAMLELRGMGYGCSGFVDGPCTYCDKCTYPEPCRFPEMLLPSVSTLGIDLKKYFDSIGRDFSFEEGKVTLYGFLFVKESGDNPDARTFARDPSRLSINRDCPDPCFGNNRCCLSRHYPRWRALWSPSRTCRPGTEVPRTRSPSIRTGANAPWSH